MRKIIVSGVMVAILMLGVTATSIFAQTAEPTKAATAWLGVAVVDQDGKVTIARVQSGSPADTADLQIGDVVASFNGTSVTTGQQLTELVQAAAPGDKATLGLTRNGESLNVSVTLGTAPARLMGRGGRGFPGAGMPATPLEVAERLLHVDLEEAEGGYKVVEVDPRNPLKFEADDVITTINGQNVTELDLDALRENLAGMETPTLTVQVSRNGETVTLESTMFGGRGGRGFGFGHGFGHGFGGKRGDKPGNPQGSGTPSPTEEAPAPTESA